MKPNKDFDVVNKAHMAAHEQFKHYRECMAEKELTETTMTKKKLYLVDTIVSFRHTYVVEANELEHAYDEITMRDSGSSDDHFDEVTQLCLGEQITGGRKISKKEFKQLLKTLETDNREVSSYWMGKDLIRKIDYGN